MKQSHQIPEPSPLSSVAETHPHDSVCFCATSGSPVPGSPHKDLQGSGRVPCLPTRKRAENETGRNLRVSKEAGVYPVSLHENGRKTKPGEIFGSPHKDLQGERACTLSPLYGNGRNLRAKLRAEDQGLRAN